VPHDDILMGWNLRSVSFLAGGEDPYAGDVLTGWNNLLIVFVSFFVGTFLARINGWLWWAGLLVSFFVGQAFDAHPFLGRAKLGWVVVPVYVVGTLVVGLIVESIAEEKRRKDPNRYTGTAQQYDYNDGGGGPGD
jgi:hypothetical protein